MRICLRRCREWLFQQFSKWSSEKFGVRRRKKNRASIWGGVKEVNLLGKFLRLASPILQTRQAGQSWKNCLKRRFFAYWIEATFVGHGLLLNPEVTGSVLVEVFIRSRHGRFAVKKKKRSCSWYWCRSRAREKLNYSVCVVFWCELVRREAEEKEVLKEVKIVK